MKIAVLATSLSALTVVVVALPLAAQNLPSQAPGPTFSARADLVMVPAIVIDHRGHHVLGLTKDDFVIRENGVEQKLATFEQVVATSAAVHRVGAAGDHVYSNLRLSDYAPRRINIVVLDLINTKWADQIYARGAVTNYLSQSVSADQLTAFLVLTPGGPIMLHDFTTNTSVLVAALRKLNGEPKASVDADADANTRLAADQQQGARAEAAQLKQLWDAANSERRRPSTANPVIATVMAFETIADTFRGVPGRKALIWVSNGFPLRPAENSWYLDHYEELFRKCNAANIAIYPIDARGLVDTSAKLEPGALSRLANEDRHTDTIQTIMGFAEMTGGRFFYNTNDLSGAMTAAAEDSSSYYLIGYYAKPATGKESWRKLSVKVQRPRLDVRARSGYFATRETTRDPGEARKRDIAEALDTPFDFTGLPFSVRVLAPEPAKQERNNLVFEVTMEPNSLSIDQGNDNYVNFQLVAVARDSESKQVGGVDRQFEAHLKTDAIELSKRQGFRQRDQVALPPGHYTLKVVLRDNISGRIGSVSAPVTVE
jgi:VWFA-related protein